MQKHTVFPCNGDMFPEQGKSHFRSTQHSPEQGKQEGTNAVQTEETMQPSRLSQPHVWKILSTA
ncbi:MAG: hypothetical protein WC166_08175 [Bacteroidales bacterium]